jgi:hypothetical protein
MMNTEDQASKKWCPMVRVGVMPTHGGPAGINDHSTEFRGNCIASDCAMWRWSPTTKREHVMGCGYDIPMPSGDPGDWDKSESDGGWVESDARLNRRRLGYCGLAGRPEAK